MTGWAAPRPEDRAVSPVLEVSRAYRIGYRTAQLVVYGLGITLAVALGVLIALIGARL